jgi:predicted phage tail protein
MQESTELIALLKVLGIATFISLILVFFSVQILQRRYSRIAEMHKEEAERLKKYFDQKLTEERNLTKEKVKCLTEEAQEWKSKAKGLQEQLDRIVLGKKVFATYAYVSLQTGLEIYFSDKNINDSIEDFKTKAGETFNPYAVYPVASFYKDYINLIASNIEITPNKDGGTFVIDLD